MLTEAMLMEAMLEVPGITRTATPAIMAGIAAPALGDTRQARATVQAQAMAQAQATTEVQAPAQAPVTVAAVLDITRQAPATAEAEATRIAPALEEATALRTATNPPCPPRRRKAPSSWRVPTHARGRKWSGTPALICQAAIIVFRKIASLPSGARGMMLEDARAFAFGTGHWPVRTMSVDSHAREFRKTRSRASSKNVLPRKSRTQCSVHGPSGIPAKEAKGTVIATLLKKQPMEGALSRAPCGRCSIAVRRLPWIAS